MANSRRTGVLDPHQLGARVYQHGVGREAVEQNSRVNVEDVVDRHRAIQLALVVTAGRHTLDGLDRGGRLAGVRVVVVDNRAEAGDEVEDVLFLVTARPRHGGHRRRHR